MEKIRYFFGNCDHIMQETLARVRKNIISTIPPECQCLLVASSFVVKSCEDVRCIDHGFHITEIYEPQSSCSVTEGRKAHIIMVLLSILREALSTKEINAN
jgi:hypothetical protein